MERARVREMERPCGACSGRGAPDGAQALVKCDGCLGTGRIAIRCKTCMGWKYVSEYIRNGQLSKTCHACRAKRPSAFGRGVMASGELLVKLALESRNRKTGPIPVSMTSARTCPPSCPLLNAGCYAEQHLIAMHWRRLSSGQGMSWNTFCGQIAGLEQGQVWRHNEAGDLPGDGELIDMALLSQLVDANRGKRGFTYTHKRPEVSTNAAAIEDANRNGFTINLSADTLAEADELASLSIAPITLVLEHNAPLKQRTPAGRHVIVCPAEYSEKVSCSTCKLCAVPTRKAIIGFRAHGDRKDVITRAKRQLPLLGV